MIVLKSDPCGASSAYANYQIIRRNGAVVSFEPSKIAVALMRAFMAVREWLPDGASLKSLAKDVLTALIDGVSGWGGRLRLPALDLKRALFVQATLIPRSRVSGVLVGVGVGGGFFSATKPNLRNAP